MLKKIVANTLMAVILFSTIMTSTVHAGVEDVPRVLKMVNRVVITELAE